MLFLYTNTNQNSYFSTFTEINKFCQFGYFHFYTIFMTPNNFLYNLVHFFSFYIKAFSHYKQCLMCQGEYCFIYNIYFFIIAITYSNLSSVTLPPNYLKLNYSKNVLCYLVKIILCIKRLTTIVLFF